MTLKPNKFVVVGVAAGLVLGWGVTVIGTAFGQDSTSINPPNPSYGVPNAATAQNALSANYATNAGSATTANYATTALNATNCTGGVPGHCGVGGGGPPPPPVGYQGVYNTTGTLVNGGCGGTPPSTPTPAQAAAIYSSPAQVPADYISEPRSTTPCCHEFSGHFCVEPDISINVTQYNLLSIITT